MKGSQKEKRGLGTALNTANSETLVVPRPEVNRRARTLWTPHGIEMLSAFVRTGAVKNLVTAQRQIAAILKQLRART
jgi:hypothetical protein